MTTVTREPLAATLTVKEVAELLQITEPTIREWLRDGKLRGQRVGDTTRKGYRWRIPRSEIERLVS